MGEWENEGRGIGGSKREREGGGRLEEGKVMERWREKKSERMSESVTGDREGETRQDKVKEI